MQNCQARGTQTTQSEALALRDWITTASKQGTLLQFPATNQNPLFMNTQLNVQKTKGRRCLMHWHMILSNPKFPSS